MVLMFEFRKCHWNCACRAAFLDVNKDFVKFCLRDHGQQVYKRQDLNQGQKLKAGSPTCSQIIRMKHLNWKVPQLRPIPSSQGLRDNAFN